MCTNEKESHNIANIQQVFILCNLISRNKTWNNARVRSGSGVMSDMSEK